MTNNISTGQHYLRSLAWVITLLGALGSVAFMFNAGHNQKSILLIVLFTGWIITPFAGLFLINKNFNRWKLNNLKSMYWLMILISTMALLAYSGVFIPVGTKTAFIFLVFPLVSWLIILVYFFIYQKKVRSGQ